MLFKHTFCRCYQNGRRVVVVPKASSAQESTWLGLATYAWSGSVLECRICGVIYRSRQHWFGNDTPEAADIVHTEISHIWPGIRTLQGTECAFRLIFSTFGT
jgi:zinc finger FYVE domain-containing protein 1